MTRDGLRRGGIGLLIVLASTGLSRQVGASSGDPHSYGNPEEARISHLALALEVDFERKVLEGRATLSIERREAAAPDAPLVLDTRGLEILSVRSGREGGELRTCRFTLGEADEVLGCALRVEMLASDDRVEVTYRTKPDATALQWVEPEGTNGGKRPFLYTQSQSIHARSWIPCHDSPGQRMTYEATVTVPEGLVAVMSAEGPMKAAGGKDSRYRFEMKQTVPAYLIALAVGELQRKELGPRTGVWAEPGVLDAAAWEFADTEKMLAAAEKRFGPYRWGQYDILVLPPSFPFGGMENARLTFATPTILAGDRSLVSLVAHELAHSWSGNLATCATWEHLWINEGLTTYLERRIVEDVYGSRVATMERELGYRGLLEEMKDLEPRDQALVGDLAGRNPDEALTGVPYDKGALFLTRLETLFGREVFDAFLRGYFDDHSFQTVDTEDFVAYLRQRLFQQDPEKAAKVDLNAWLRGTGLPAETVIPVSEPLLAVSALARRWEQGVSGVEEIPWKDWTTLERLHFLKALAGTPKAAQMEEFDRAFEVTAKANPEVVVPWLELAVRSGYSGSDARLESFLTTIGRQKFLVPLYKALVETEQGRARALVLFRKASVGYHPITRLAISKLVTPPDS